MITRMQNLISSQRSTTDPLSASVMHTVAGIMSFRNPHGRPSGIILNPTTLTGFLLS